MRGFATVVILTLCIVLAGCSDGEKSSVATPTPRGLPSPVAIPPDTADGFTLADPGLDALAGATVDSAGLAG